MARPITTLAIFFISLSLFAQLLLTSGVAATLGLQTQIGGDEATAEVTQSAEGQVETGAPTGDTLFGLYNVLTSQLKDILAIFNPGLDMMANAGVPDVIIYNLLMPIVSIIKIIGIISFLRGWDL